MNLVRIEGLKGHFAGVEFVEALVGLSLWKSHGEQESLNPFLKCDSDYWKKQKREEKEAMPPLPKL